MRAAIELATLAAGVAGISALAGLDTAVWLVAVAAMVLHGAIVALALARFGAADRPLGWPNRVTVLRGLLGAILLGSLAGRVDTALVAAIAVGALALDAVDGWLARRLEAESAFGARLDMETDAAIILVLCLVLIAQGRAGVWLLVVGLARYAFVAAAALVAALRRPLPPSERRRGAAAVVMIGLALALLPLVPPEMARAIAIVIALVTLASFAIDVGWLLSRGAHR